MRVAALYDVHGNLPALEAVLAEVAALGVDAVVCGGDVVWGAQPVECLASLREAGALFIRGNADREVAEGSSEADRWCAAQLGQEACRFLAGLPTAVELDVDGLGATLFCHGSPRSDEEILTRATPDGAVGEALAGVPAGVVVCGHTHVQFDRLVGGVRLVNAGSIGLPYEGDADARWARLGPTVELRRTAYDVERGAVAAEASGFPQREMIARKLRTPSSAEEATAFFEGRRGA